MVSLLATAVCCTPAAMAETMTIEASETWTYNADDYARYDAFDVYGVLDTRAQTFEGKSITLQQGGTLTNTNTANSTNWGNGTPLAAGVMLAGDASIVGKGTNLGGEVNLNGHTLTIKEMTDGGVYFRGASSLTGSGTISVQSRTLQFRNSSIDNNAVKLAVGNATVEIRSTQATTLAGIESTDNHAVLMAGDIDKNSSTTLNLAGTGTYNFGGTVKNNSDNATRALIINHTGEGTQTFSGTISSGTINGVSNHKDRTVISGTVQGGTITNSKVTGLLRGGTFQNVIFEGSTVNGTITLNGVSDDGMLQTALSGLSVAQGGTSTLNMGAGEYTINDDLTVNGHRLNFTDNGTNVVEINGRGWDGGNGHTFTLSNGASINATQGLKVESKALLKVTGTSSVSASAITLGHSTTEWNNIRNYGALTMEGGSITTSAIQKTAGTTYTDTENTFTMSGGTLTFTQNTTSALSGIQATITGGTLSTASSAWTIDNTNAKLSGVTISGDNSATLKGIKLGNRTTVQTDVNVVDSITSVDAGNNSYAFLVNGGGTLTFSATESAAFDLTNAGAGIGIGANSQVVVANNTALTLKTFLYSSQDEWKTSNGNLTVQNGGEVTITGQGYNDTYLAGMNLAGQLTVNSAATVNLATLTGAESAGMTLNGTMTVVNATETTLGALTLGAGATLTLGTADSHDNNLNITSSLTVEGSSQLSPTLNANLVMTGGVMSFAHNAQLTMGCSVTIGDTVKVVLTDEDIAMIQSGQTVDLILSADDIRLGSGVRELSNIYRQNSDGTLTKLSSDFKIVADVDNNKIYAMPEPATATLSLLALAALATRRRRR